MLLLALLSLPLSAAYFEECSCPSLKLSTICPTSRCEEAIEKNCELACPKDTTLYYKTGLPWKRATNISCVSGEYHADIREGFKNLWHITCARPPSCSNCAELLFAKDFCPDGYVCSNTLSEVRLNGCNRLSCREGDLVIINANKTVSEVFTLQCSEGGAWMDVRERVYTNIPAVTCAMRRSCQTCSLPTDLDSCRGDAACYKGKLNIRPSKIGNCRIASCNEREFMIRARSVHNETLIESSNSTSNSTLAPPVIYEGVSELRCDEKGEWTVATYEDWEKNTVNLGRDVEAVCYWPKCKRCWVEEMDCPPGEICSIDWMAEPDRTQECDVATCRNGTEMIFRDKLGILRTVRSLRCSDTAEWVVVPTQTEIIKQTKKVSLFDNDYVDGAEQKAEAEEALTPPTPTELNSRRASVTCKKIIPPCQKCATLKKSEICPGGPEKICNEIMTTGGSATDQCSVISCGPDNVLWSYHLMRWNTLNSYLECSTTGEWKLPGGTVIPDHAELSCKYNGECQCAGARLGTSSACKTTWERGCDTGAVDLFAKAGECSKIECRYNGQMAIFKPNSNTYVKTINGSLTCIGNGKYQDQFGNKYTYLDSAVTCHSWEGARHCARACTWAPQDSNTTVFTEWSDENGCRNLRCTNTERMELHDTDSNTWIVRKSLNCAQIGYWTSEEDRGAMIFPYKTVDKNFIEVRCVPNPVLKTTTTSKPK